MFDFLENQTLEDSETRYIDFFEDRLESSDYNGEDIHHGVILSRDENQEYGIRVHISRVDEPEIPSVRIYGDMPLDVALEYVEEMDCDGFYGVSITDSSDERGQLISQLFLNTRES